MGAIMQRQGRFDVYEGDAPRLSPPVNGGQYIDKAGPIEGSHLRSATLVGPPSAEPVNCARAALMPGVCFQAWQYVQLERESRGGSRGCGRQAVPILLLLAAGNISIVGIASIRVLMTNLEPQAVKSLTAPAPTAAVCFFRDVSMGGESDISSKTSAEGFTAAGLAAGAITEPEKAKRRGRFHVVEDAESSGSKAAPAQAASSGRPAVSRNLSSGLWGHKPDDMACVAGWVGMCSYNKGQADDWVLSWASTELRLLHCEAVLKQVVLLGLGAFMLEVQCLVLGALRHCMSSVSPFAVHSCQVSLPDGDLCACTCRQHGAADVSVTGGRRHVFSAGHGHDRRAGGQPRGFNRIPGSLAAACLKRCA